MIKEGFRHNKVPLHNKNKYWAPHKVQGLFARQSLANKHGLYGMPNNYSLVVGEYRTSSGNISENVYPQLYIISHCDLTFTYNRVIFTHR